MAASFLDRVVAGVASLEAAERVCRDFAGQYPTPNVLAAIDHAEHGRILWDDLAELFERSLRAGLESVTA